MTKLAVEAMATLGYRRGTYNKDKWFAPSLFTKRTDTSPNYLGPLPVGVARPVEQSAAIPGIYPWAMQWCDKEGLYITGTVGASGTAVTGNGTGWLAAGIPVNARIGFGSTDPDQITTWYTITAIASATALTLGTSAGTITAGTSYVIDLERKIDWVFLADNATAANTRRLQMYEYNRLTSSWGWRGYITLTYPTASAHTIKGFRMAYEKYTAGTVSVSTTAVTGNGSTWSTDRISVGSRIGFGSTDPTQITTWYQISAVGSDTSITLTGSAGTIGAGTSYVIEELWAITATTNATTTNGGLYVTKGLQYADFTSGGTTIPAATTTDKIKAVYWLADASTVTNITACGVGLEPRSSWASQFVYVIDSATIKIFKYNIRAALTLASGKDTTTLALATGNQAVTGTLSTTNNCRFATTSHGPASGVPALYFVTTTRIYCVPTANITSGSTTFLTYTMTEVPPGGTNTFAATGALACIEYANAYDRFIITSTGAAGVRSYVTQFRTDAGQIDNIFLNDDKQIDQSTADGSTTPHPTILAVTQTPWSEGGLLYLAGVGTTAATNLVHAIPLGADWNYTTATAQRLISPEISTPNCNKFARVYAMRDRIIGGDSLGKPPDPFKILYRTSGITDNSGSWNVVPDGNDLSGAGNASSIQFAFDFRCISDFCIPARLYGVGVVYDDLSTDSHYRFSAGKSSTASKRFAFKFAVAFGGTVPTLRIRLYNDTTNGLLLDDTTAVSGYGTWEKSTDGTNWTAYNTTDKGNDTTYIRYTPTTLADNIQVRALLTQ